MNYFDFLAIVWSALGVITFFILILYKIKAPYGRHSSNKWGIMISNHWGWFWMELPAFIIMPTIAILGPSDKTETAWLLISLWTYHYFFRTLIFPFRLKTKGKKMPLIIVLSALFFNGINGLLNGYYIGYIFEDQEPLFSLHIIAGIMLFLTGLIINRSSDKLLISLRKKQAGYLIPKSGLFEYISCPNHFGEIIEWLGFALIAWNLPALSFLIWTICNLIPRSLNHHQWYKNNFPDYPKSRKAVLPFIW